MKSLTGNRECGRVSLEQPAHLYEPPPALPPDARGKIVKKENQKEGIAEQSTQNGFVEQKPQQMEPDTENWKQE